MNESELTTEKLREIYRECDGDLSKVASRLGMSQEAMLNYIAPQPSPPRRTRLAPNDPGRASLRQYIVSMRHVDVPEWPVKDRNKIDRARTDYENGTHEMFQGKDRGWYILYSQPRKRRVVQRKFFRSEA